LLPIRPKDHPQKIKKYFHAPCIHVVIFIKSFCLSHQIRFHQISVSFFLHTIFLASLYTSVHTRSKSNSVPARVRAQSAPINNQIQCQTTTTTTNQNQTKPVQPIHSNDPNRVDNKEKTVENSSYPPPRHSLHIPNLKKSYKPYKPPTSKDIKSSLNGSMSESIAKRSQQKDLGKKTAKSK
jgi:hypothetical protein